MTDDVRRGRRRVGRQPASRLDQVGAPARLGADRQQREQGQARSPRRPRPGAPHWCRGSAGSGDSAVGADRLPERDRPKAVPPDGRHRASCPRAAIGRSPSSGRLGLRELGHTAAMGFTRTRFFPASPMSFLAVASSPRARPRRRRPGGGFIPVGSPSWSGSSPRLAPRSPPGSSICTFTAWAPDDIAVIIVIAVA